MHALFRGWIYFLKCSFILQVSSPCSSAACFLSRDEQGPELCVALAALSSETQCHEPLSQSCLGLQVTSCLPVFLSSGTAGAINQLRLSPGVSVCSALLWPAPHTTNTTTTLDCLCLIWSVAPLGDTPQLFFANTTVVAACLFTNKLKSQLASSCLHESYIFIGDFGHFTPHPPSRHLSE